MKKRTSDGGMGIMKVDAGTMVVDANSLGNTPFRFLGRVGKKQSV